MYAVLETGSKQYRVSAGDTVEVERLEVEAGQPVTLDRVLLVNNEGTVSVGTPTVTIHCDFAKAMRIGDTLRFDLRVTKMGRSSVQLDYRGSKDGEPHLHIVQTIAFADLDRMQSVPIPEFVRPNIERFLVS